jgi:hypothetical protein
MVPSGHIDYSIRTPGYVPLHRWDRRLAPGQDVDLGKLKFEKGSSLLGRIATPKNWKRAKGDSVRVELLPQTLPSHRTGEASRSRMRANSVVPNARGFFTFDGIEPGAYEVSASAKGLISERRKVDILDGLQAELRTPLILTPPLTINVAVDPPVDPWGTPWTIDLSRVERTAVIDAQHVHTAAATEAGSWTHAGLSPGDYLVKVQRVRGTWHSQLVHITEDTEVPIRIPLAKVAGELRLGGMPLAGTIWFGGELGDVSIPIRTNPDGHFKAYLPIVDGGFWREVDVAANHPFVRTTLTDIRLQGPDADGISTVELVLPTNRLFGEVVLEEDGKPASSNATVYASLRDTDTPPLQDDVDSAGIFSFTGLKLGTYSVYAIGAHGKSTAADVEIDERSAAEMKIILRRDRLLEGTVRSRYGAVSGARVSAYPDDRTGFGIVQWDQTDFEGHFAVEVAPGVQNVTLTVVAPGYAYTLLAVPASPEEPLVIFIEQEGGRIVTDLPEAHEGSRRPYLFHGRAFVAVAALENAAVASRSGTQQILENLSPGQYDICVATAHEALILASASSRSSGGRCSSGFLARGSVLEMRPTN